MGYPAFLASCAFPKFLQGQGISENQKNDSNEASTGKRRRRRTTTVIMVTREGTQILTLRKMVLGGG